MPSQVISTAKRCSGLRPHHIDVYDPIGRTYQKIYAAYQETCDRAGLVDFAELLLRVPMNSG